MKIELLFIILLLIILYYKKYKTDHFTMEYYNNVYVNRNLIGTASCIKDDIELPNSYFKCQMNRNYLPININVNAIKYQNFAPYLIKIPSESFKLLSTLTPDLTPPPLLSDTDFLLVGTTTNELTKTIKLNDHTKLMKIYNYITDDLLLFNKLPTNVKPVAVSLEDNNFIYLPDSLINYMKYLNDMEILSSYIDVNKIDTLPNIANQFKYYLQGKLIPIVKPPTDDFRLHREVVVIYDSAYKKNIINIRFNQIITWYDSNNKEHNDVTINNIHTKSDFLIINSCNNINDKSISSIVNKINIYGNHLKSRNLITNYLIDDLVDKVNNFKKHNILYINFYYITDPFDFGIELVKRVNGKLIYINYFDLKYVDDNVPFSYYKSICPDPVNNLLYKSRCYSKCPDGYSSMGLACVLDSEKNNSFNPGSNYCNQVCNASNSDLRNFDPVLQKACWCKSASCDKCGEFSIGECGC